MTVVFSADGKRKSHPHGMDTSLHNNGDNDRWKKQHAQLLVGNTTTALGLGRCLLFRYLLVCTLGHPQVLQAEAFTHVQTASIDAATGESIIEEDSSVSSSSSFSIATMTPISLEGIDLPIQRELGNGKVLYRNGHGIRSFAFYGLSMKMYVASFYTETPLRSEEDVLSCDCPLLFHFTFLRGVGQGKVKLAWQKQLEWSVTHHSYEGYENDRDAFINMFGPMEYKGTVTVKILDDDTDVLDQGKVKGTIKGVDFQRAFLSMWFGERAVADELKIGLLGSHNFTTTEEG